MIRAIRRHHPTQVDVATSGDRMLWMDVLRGVAIVLIVQLHASALLGANGLAPSSTLLAIDAVLQPFRIPLLLLLSGMLVPQGIAKGAKRFIATRVRTILWPLVVWSTVLALAYPAMRWESVTSIPTGPVTYLWYLHALLLCSLAALLLRRVPSWASASVAYAVALAAHVVDDTEWLDTAVVERWALLLAYLLTGAALRARMDRIAPLLRRGPVITAMLAIAVGLVVMSALSDNAVAYTDAIAAPLVLASLLGTIGIAMRVAVRGPLIPLAAVGRRSVVTYVLHWFVLDATIPAAMHAVGLWPGAAATVQAVAVVVTLVVCAGVAALAERSRAIGWLFRL